MGIFAKRTWKDSIAEYPNRRVIKDVTTQAEQVVTVTRSPGTVSQEGDSWSAENMNDMEDRIDEAIDTLNNDLTHNTYEVPTSLWVTNTDNTTKTDYPKVAFVTITGLTSNDKPICELFGSGAVTTIAELDDIALIREAVSEADGIRLYATGTPTHALVLDVMGA